MYNFVFDQLLHLEKKPLSFRFKHKTAQKMAKNFSMEHQI